MKTYEREVDGFVLYNQEDGSFLDARRKKYSKWELIQVAEFYTLSDAEYEQKGQYDNFLIEYKVCEIKATVYIKNLEVDDEKEI